LAKLCLFSGSKQQKTAKNKGNEQRKRELRSEIACCEDEKSDDMCNGCDCWKQGAEQLNWNDIKRYFYG